MKIKLFYAIILLTVFCPAVVWATATGLNNIPTADVVPQNVLVFQFIGDLANDSTPGYTTGFKYGPAKNIEIGLDGVIFPQKAKNETLVAQAKMRFELDPDLSFALGISNLGDRARAGNESPYAVLTQNLDFLRIHFGGTSQNDNEGVFGGIDKTIQFLERDLTLRSDIIQTNEQRDTTTSAGFSYDLGCNFLIETWVSFPSESGKEDVTTIKFNYVIKF